MNQLGTLQVGTSRYNNINMLWFGWVQTINAATLLLGSWAA